MVKFDVTRKEHEIIAEIVARAKVVASKHGSEVNRTELLMDLTACHANGCRLDLELLLLAPEFDFAHDVFGISRHLNRRTGKLENSFLPRYASIGDK